MKARTDGSIWLQHVDQQPRGLPSWPLRVGVVVLPWPSPVPTTRLCAACCEAGNPHLVHQSWGHAAHEIRSGTFFVVKLVIKNRSLRPYAQYVVPHSDFGCWLAQVLLVFTCWSAVLLHNDAEQESGTVAPCILVDAEPQTYNCNLVIGTKQRKCNFVLDNS